MRAGLTVALVATPVLAGSAPALAQTGRGSLFIVGGGESPPELARRFVELAGGTGRARIAVIPMASSVPRETGDEKVQELTALGATAYVVLLDREQALDSSAARTLDSATGIWFSGGDQARLTAILSGTPVLAAMHRRYRSGVVLGGTSAGAAIMSDSMLTGNQHRPDSLGYYGDEFPTIARGTIEVVPGLGFLPGTIVDQHFLRRERHNRLLSTVLERPALIGVGIDEGTALEVAPDGQWRVLGASAVAVYDARRSVVTPPDAPRLGARDVWFHLLPSGSRFDPAKGVVTLPH